MKKSIIFLLLLVGIGYILFIDYSTKETLKEVSKKYNPSEFNLTTGYDSFVKNRFLEDGTEMGIIYLKDGNYSKYWFKSHHLVDDMGGTWFEMSDGTKEYMAGYFCCEVQLNQQPLSLYELKKFIKENHESYP